VGGRSAADESLQDAFAGALDEIRIWQTARAEEQILDNVFTRLHGETENLIAYYPFDAESTVAGARSTTSGCAATT
jgi:hypothetical protein